ALVLLAVTALPLLAPQARAQASHGLQEQRELPRQRVVATSREEDEDRPSAPTLPHVFGEDAVVDHAPFRQAVKRAYEDPLLDRSRTRMVWLKRKDDAPPPERPTPPWLRTLGQALAVAAEFGLWIVLGLVVLALALTARRWLPWMRGVGATRTPDSEVTVSAAAEPDAFADDSAGQGRGLWRRGRPRPALALLPPASVH